MEACPFGRTPDADATEREVWEAIRDVLLGPARFRKMLREHREAEKRRVGDPGAEAKRLAAVIADCDRKRAKNQEMFRADATTLEELRESLAALARAREEAEERRRRLEAQGAEGEALIALYEGFAAEDLYTLGGEARREVYNHLGVSVFAAPSRNEPLKIVFGALGGDPVWQRDRTSTR